MCISIPGKVILIKGKKAKIKQGDHSHWVDISSIDEKIKIGDYLLCYQNVATNKLSEREAKESLSLLENLNK
jgi:hydrogenase assembly chaperone HypC/HupF